MRGSTRSPGLGCMLEQHRTNGGTADTGHLTTRDGADVLAVHCHSTAAALQVFEIDGRGVSPSESEPIVDGEHATIRL